MAHHQTMPGILSAATVIAFVVSLTPSTFAKSVSRFIDDVTITAKVKEGIFEYSQLKIFQVRVYTFHGLVTLSGKVETDTQKTEVVKIATQMQGVSSVTDELSINTIVQ